ncbi:MAG: hypothetical protein ACUVQ8_00385 [Nitrososphaeria archaeon]
MSRTVELLKNKFILISSLHTNSLELAVASEESGADAIELHLNIEDAASAVRFGGIDLEENAVREVIGSVKAPVGVWIGDMPIVSKEEWEKIVGTGVDYVKMLAHHMPSYVYNDDRIKKIVSVGSGYVLEQVEILSQDGRVSAIEASIMTPQVFRLPLTLFDISNYTLITRRSSKPVIVPSQKFIEPADLAILKRIGIEGIVTNSIVTGTTQLSYREVLTEFRRTADRL